MPAKRRSTFAVLGLPQAFGVTLLTLFLILAVGPYLSGLDFGIVKVPQFGPGATRTLSILGPALLAAGILLFVRVWPAHEAAEARPVPGEKSVETTSKYRLQNIGEIVKAEAAARGIRIDGLAIGDRLTITDLERICARAWYPAQPAQEIGGILRQARAKAFTLKYAEPREDEKLARPSEIKLAGLRPWQEYFMELLKDLGVNDVASLDVLDVGIGNGYADAAFLSQVHAFRAVDISEEALRYARSKLPQMTSHVCEAEELRPIANGSVDLYVSLRAFQSTLFDRRTALHEAYRVLRNGGRIVVSIPTMLLRSDGTVLQGLMPPGSGTPSAEYAERLIGRIQEYMTILNFADVGADRRSPFEVYLHGRR
ncbi:MAG TPA: class I SAM-dependent methyltransferase [Candidatus Saccharimonadales bacterium]|nr:class I SAM-dependent methyltransferase [Candidatus Saccharimonadales bacterium]